MDNKHLFENTPPIITTNNNLKDIIKNNKINKKIIINSDKYSHQQWKK